MTIYSFNKIFLGGWHPYKIKQQNQIAERK